MEPSRDIDRLIAIMAALRDPETGCPWDIRQTSASIRDYTIEEAYEVAEAIDSNDPDDLCDELGDLLLQVVFHARMAEERADFDFGDVVGAITAKLVRRHPHVFARATAETADAVKTQWTAIKAREKADRARRRARRGLASDEPAGLLGKVRRAQPALAEALALQVKAAEVGFDWSTASPILAKMREEIDELEEALESGSAAAVGDEIGDIVFAAVNLARHAGIDPEEALRGTSGKFRRRFSHIEKALDDEGIAPADAGLERMESLWQAAKAIERDLKADGIGAPTQP